MVTDRFQCGYNPDKSHGYVKGRGCFEREMTFRPIFCHVTDMIVKVSLIFSDSASYGLKYQSLAGQSAHDERRRVMYPDGKSEPDFRPDIDN